MGFLDDLTRAIGDLGQAAARARAQRLAGWGQLAQQLGVPFDGSTSAGIHVQMHGVAAHVDTYTSTTRNANGHTSTSRSTRFRAATFLGAGPRYTVTRDGGGAIAETLRGLFSIRDEHLGGDDAFDHAFVVQTVDLPWTRQAWTPRAKQLRMADPAGRVSSDGKTVTFRLSGHVYDPARLRNGLELVIELARVSSAWIETLRAMVGPDARIVPGSGRWDRRVPPSIDVGAGSIVRVFPVRVLAGVGVAAVCPPARDLPFFDTRFAGGRTERALREDVLEGRAPELLRAAGQGRLYFRGGQVEVTIDGRLDEGRVRAACDLAERIATGGGPAPRSAYR